MIKKEHIITTVVMTVALIAGFYATDQYMALQLLKGGHFWSPSIRWDHAIPFVPGWIWIYLLYFPICFLPITLKEIWNDRGIFRRIAAGFVLQFAAALTFFWIFPSRMQRPIFEAAGINRQVVLWFYEIDRGFNIFPSLHVANVAYIACIAWGLKRKSLSAVIWAFCFLIATSTVLVKQHYLFDLLSGIFIGIAGYFAAFSKGMNFLDLREIRLEIDLPLPPDPVIIAKEQIPTECPAPRI